MATEPKAMGTRYRPVVPHGVVVMGVSGSGKSTLAALLAQRIGCPLLEGDDYHAAASIAKMRAGQPLDDADRWPWLDRLGEAIGVAAAGEAGGGTPGTGGIAVSACSALKRSYRDRLSAASRVPLRFILLETRQEELTRRLVARAGHYMPASLLESQLAILEPPGADECALTLEATTAPDALCNLALAWLRTNSPADGERAG
jgi:gluconokinase